jgi:hypothetical protein
MDVQDFIRCMKRQYLVNARGGMAQPAMGKQVARKNAVATGNQATGTVDTQATGKGFLAVY